MVRKMSEKLKISGVIVSFLIGFAYNQGNGIRLSKEMVFVFFYGIANTVLSGCRDLNKYKI